MTPTDHSGRTDVGVAGSRWRAVALAGHTADRATAISAIVDADPEVRVLGLGALARLDVLDDVVVLAALADPVPTVRRRAATLAATRRTVSLLNTLDDAEPTVVETAAWACGEQEVVDDAVLLRLIDLATTAGEALVREAAVAALGAIGDPRGEAAVLTACTDKPAVRRRAVLALASFDGPAVDAALAAALDDRDWQVRQAAEDVTNA